MTLYYQCPDCGFQQRSKAQERVKCHKCGRSYLKRKAKKTTEKEVKRKGFFRFSKD